MEYDANKYEKGAQTLLEKNTVIFVEGKSNKLFYAQFNEISHIPVLTPLERNEGTSSCNHIKKLVKKNAFWHAILDGDFNLSNILDERVYYIDYYSLENIVLENHSFFEELKYAFERFIDENGLSICQNEIYSIKIDRENSTYEITKHKNIDSQYKNYINSKIKNSSHYIKYMPVKKLICSFDSFLPTKHKGYKKNCYFQNLYNELSNKSLLNLFSNTDNKHYDNFKLLLNKL